MQALKSAKSWNVAIHVVKKLQSEGHEAVFAGGCVRDALLGLASSDIDVATSALPDEVEALFSKTLNIGKAFGVIVVVEGDHSVEVATFRGEGAYMDGRHPQEIEFTSAQRDAIRRDFTVNGMFYDPIKKELLDFVEGERDLRARVLRTIGRPEQRFSEDYLRILRAARFSAQLGFSIDVCTAAAMKSARENLQKLSSERVTSEIEKILTSSRPAVGLQVLQTLELADVIFKPWYSAAKFNQSVEIVKRLSQRLVRSREFLWAGLFWGAVRSWGASSGELPDWMKSNKFSNALGDSVKLCLLLSEQVRDVSSLKLPYFWIWLDAMNSPESVQFLDVIRHYEGVREDSFAQVIAQFLERIDPKTGRLQKPRLSGKDLLEAGVAAGPKVGELLDQAYHYQLIHQEDKKNSTPGSAV
jgi:tRNA nucleotidyltransferase/poly(A) polymerase